MGKYNKYHIISYLFTTMFRILIGATVVMCYEVLRMPVAVGCYLSST